MISLRSKGLSRVFSNNTVQKHQFFGAQLSSLANVIKQQKGKRMEERNKSIPFHRDICIEKSQRIKKNHLKLINEVPKFTVQKVNLKKSVVFLYKSNE